MSETLQLPTRTRNTLCKMATVGVPLEFLPMTGAPSDRGIGRKIFFPIPMKHEPTCMEDFLYVFAESKLPFTPKECDLGYTEQDIEDTTGIYLFKKRGDQAKGSVYPLEALFREVFTDLSLQNRIIFKLNEMKRMAHLDNEFLDAANADRASHSPDDLEKVKRVH